MVAMIFVGALAGLEWWVSGDLRGSGGPLLGMALFGVVGVVGALLRQARSTVIVAWLAALSAVAELGVAVALIAGLAVPLALLLPDPLIVRLMRDDVATDVVVFCFLGLGLVVAARGWSGYARQAAEVARERLGAERARADLAERERELVRTELALLRAQVEPHFLWNTLGNVQYLTDKDPAAAHAMVGHLIRYLRACVPQVRGGTSSVASEMDSVRAYLELMKVRMGPRLAVNLVTQPDCAGCALPPLLLQTLVENAIKHGLEPKVGAAELSVRVALLPAPAARLRIEVADNGVGLQPAPRTRGTGLGLASIRDRLRALYGSDASLSVAQGAAGGVTAAIEFPATPAGADEE
jgi:signal transduction histidine kinase